MASPPSSPSESSLLAFAYDKDLNGVEYPHGHDQSQPQTPTSASIARSTSHNPRHGKSVRTYSLSSLDLSRVSSQSRLPMVGNDEEYNLEVEVGNKRTHGSQEIDPFSNTELMVMSGSSLMVLALVVVAILLTFGKITL